MKTIYKDYIENEDGSITTEKVVVIEYDVYFLMNDNKVIYIGCSSNIINRIKDHKSIRIFDSYFVYKSFFNKQEALDCERQESKGVHV